MRAMAVVLGLLIAITVSAVALLAAIVDAEFVLDTAAATLKNEGVEIQSDNESTLTIFPSLELKIPSASLTIFDLESDKKQYITVERLHFKTTVPKLLFSRSGRLSVDQITTKDIQLAEISTDIVLADGLSLPNLTAVLWGGELAADIDIDGSQTPAKVHTSGTLIDADAQSTLAMLDHTGIVKGRLTTAWDLTLKSNSNESGMTRIEGPLSIKGEKVALGIDLHGSIIGSITEALGGKRADMNPEGTLLETFEMIQTHSGQLVSVDSMKLETRIVAVNATGKLDRKSKLFSATAKAKFDASELAKLPNAKILEKFADQEWPIQCEGRTDNGRLREWCVVDFSTLAKQSLSNEIERALKVDKPAETFKSLLRRLK